MWQALLVVLMLVLGRQVAEGCSCTGRILVTFEVDQVWKGPARPTALLRTVENKWTCDGYFFKAGSQYLVAAQRVLSEGSTSKPAELEGVSLCGGTASLAQAHDDVAKLGRAKRPKKVDR